MNVGEHEISHTPIVQRLVPFVGFVHFVLHPPQLLLSYNVSVSHPFVIVASQFALFAIQLAPVHALYDVPAHVFVPLVVNGG